MGDAPQLSKDAYDRAVAFLKSHGAGETPHVNSTLLAHLEGTCELLRRWGNPEPLCLAGLCHAVYGTDGFAVAFLDPLSLRSQLRAVIGAEAEAIVYFYASCDRRYVYPQIGRGGPVEFRDRFSERVFAPDRALWRAFLELTFANELELVTTPALVDYTRETFGVMFRGSRDLVSEAAFAHFAHLCGEPALIR